MRGAAEAAARAAGAIIRPLFRAALAVTEKQDLSPVTKADRDAERAMRAVLAERFPEDGLLGEEFGSERPDARFCWVLDPIDGTRAFITGRPQFGTLIARLDRGRPMFGMIDQPVTGERWIGFGKTEFRGPLGGRVGARSCGALARAELSATSLEMFSPQDLAPFMRLKGACRRMTWGGDCYAYGLLALGAIDIVAEASLKPWDWAALVPIIEGAGGCMTDWHGVPLRPEGSGRVLAVGDPSLLAPAIAALSGKSEPEK